MRKHKVLCYFCTALLEAFEGTYEGALKHHLGCEVARDMNKGTTYHYATEIRRTYNFWNATAQCSPMQPNTRISSK